MNTLVYLRDKSLNSEGFKQKVVKPVNRVLEGEGELRESSKIVSKKNMNIDSKVIISGLENMNSISTLQKNNTLNSVNFTNYSKNLKY